MAKEKINKSFETKMTIGMLRGSGFDDKTIMREYPEAKKILSPQRPTIKTSSSRYKRKHTVQEQHPHKNPHRQKEKEQKEKERYPWGNPFKVHWLNE